MELNKKSITQSPEEKEEKKDLIDRLYESSVEYFVNWRKHLKEYFWAVLIVLALRSTVGVFYRIPTGSMIPTFRIGDMLVANRFYYGLKLPFTDGLDGYRLPAIRELEVGDVVVFLGPREELFHDLTIYFDSDLSKNSAKSQQVNLLRKLNNASKFKKAIYPLEHQTQEDLIEGLNEMKNILSSEVNYIFMDFDLERGQALLHLEDRVYQQYQKTIHQLFTVVNTTQRPSVVPYNEWHYQGFFHNLLSVPIAGLSMVLQVLSDTPLFFHYYQLTKFLNQEEKDSNPTSFQVYPNRFTDQSKEYVKRLIAKEGDKVEIHNKKVFINDRPLEWEPNFEPDPYNPTFSISKEALYHSPKNNGKNNSQGDKKAFSHPLRLSEQIISPFFKFDPKLWPYEPEGIAAAGFRDNFGPIVVPKGHYFMMGDNRDESLDSRYFGTVPKWAVKGTPMVVFYPWNRRGVIH